ncbi:MAG: hypothetical protein AAF658_09900 [Myxococcota bacterium]
MGLRIAFLAGVLLVALPAVAEAAKKSVTCGENGKLRVTKVQRRSRGVIQRARKNGIHVLDLGEAGRARVRAWRGALRKKDWCAVDREVGELESLIDSASVTEAFVRSKVDRARLWVDGTLKGRRSKRANKLVNGASADLETGKLRPANGKLNKVMSFLTGSKDVLALPRKPLRLASETASDTPADPSATTTTAVAPPRVETYEPPPEDPRDSVLIRGLALESCPELEEGEPSNGGLASILERLRTEMAAKKFRAVDFKYGPELFEILEEEGRDGSRDRAAVAACVLLTRIAETRIGLGVVQGRFNRVNTLRDDRGVPASVEDRFLILVRQATDQIGARKFEDAYATLDELLVLLGDPVDQAADVP